MKKALLLPACLALGAASAGAQNITLSGVADAAVRHVHNQGRGSAKSVVNGGNATSRLIVRGAEDLGGGLSAAFHLEHGLLLDRGTQAAASTFWDRRATASLASKTLGEVRLGRDYIPSYLNWGRFDPFAYVGAASSSNLIATGPVGPIRAAFGTGQNALTRANNTVQWWLPRGWGGLEGQVLVSAPEGNSAANGGHKVMGARLGYASGLFTVSAATTHTKNDLTAGRRLKDHALGGSYDFGVLRLSAALRRFELADAQQTNLLLGARIPYGRMEFKLSLHQVDMSGRVGATSIDDHDARQLGLGAVYSLSKRSVLYATVSRIDNDGAAFVVAGGPAGMPAGGASTGAEIGMRHTF